MAKISVLGAGSWGTALSILLSNNGHEVRLWSRFQEEVDALRETRELTSKLPGVHIPEDIDITADLKDCIETAEVLVLAVPSPYIRSTSKLMAPDVKKGQIIVNVAKGIEENTLMTRTDIISEEIPAAAVYVLSGPSHAEEVGRGIPTIVAKNTAQPEVTRELCYYYEPADCASALADVIMEELQNPMPEEKLRFIADEMRKHYSYDIIAKEYWDLILACKKAE